MVFSIGLGERLDRECTRPWARRYNSQRQQCPEGESLEAVLRQLSGSTGGRLLLTKSARRLRNAFEEVAEDLRNQYSVAYSSDKPEKQGEWREVTITVPGRPELRVISREGYFATER